MDPEINNGSIELCEILNKFRNENVACDVTIQIGNKTFCIYKDFYSKFNRII